MIHDIQNPIQALAILHDIAACALLTNTTVFILDKELDPNDISTCLLRCEICGLTIDFKTGYQPVIECQYCQRALKVIVSVDLVIQGDILIWRDGW